jgi:hypothetical protein
MDYDSIGDYGQLATQRERPSSPACPKFSPSVALGNVAEGLHF